MAVTQTDAGLKSVHERAEYKRGFSAATLAFLAWGVTPLYWKPLSEFPPVWLIGFRILYSLLFLGLVIARRKPLRSELRSLSRKKVGLLFLSAALIFINWYVFVYAVTSGQVLQASLGYFINPLVSVGLGMLFFGERLRRNECFAVTLASIGVLVLAASGSEFPWISIVLALSFGFYGLIKKSLATTAVVGLFVETLVLLPLAGVILISSGPSIPISLPGHIYIFACGLVTVTPLLLFGYGARRIELKTVGLLQYVGPSVQFILAVFLFREAFPLFHQIAFGFIWLALLCYSLPSIRLNPNQPESSAL